MNFLRKAFLAIGLTAVLLLGAYFTWRALGTELYKSFSSPNGQFVIKIYRHPMLMCFPGQSGDADGYAALYDHMGKQLGKAYVDMVGGVDENSVRWYGTEVIIVSIADWTLPTDSSRM